ncbi:TOMM precursor leader peptide-binding protein [Kitasatospora sp. NPDC088391]|uniref:TOMM precursor leader peptide-binding protein n=1 Tax=Kitasatospora sp. NPDC088391 TaxID=3364074 RepID=UPI0038277016
MSGEPLPVLDVEQALASSEGAAVVRLPAWTLETAERLSRAASGRAVRWVPVREDGALTVVGPVLGTGSRACLVCVERQRLATAGGRVPWPSGTLALGGAGTPAFSAAVAALAAALLAEQDPEHGATVHLVDGDRATWSTHLVRPVGGCPVCAPLPEDAADRDIEAGGTPRPLPDPQVLRGPNDRTGDDRTGDDRTGGDGSGGDGSGGSGGERMRAALSDERFGPVRRLFRTEDSAFALTTAWVTEGRLLDDGGYGRAADYRTSERVALFEAVERLAGMRPLGRRTALHGSPRELARTLGADAVLDPVRLGLPDETPAGQPGVAAVPYTPELDLDWVHGWSLTHRRAVAVPEHVAYWDVPGRTRVVYESSNGCGLGNSPEEAVLYGLFEVAERDAFLMAWYPATPLPAVAVPEDDPEVAALADRARLLGHRLTLLDATNDLGIPAVIAVCRYTGRHPDAPRAFLAAGAHHDPRAAIRSAVAEVVTNVQEAPHRDAAQGGPRDPARLRTLLDRPELVVSLDDHVGVNALPEAADRLEFLFQGPPPVPWQQRWPGAPQPVDDLGRLLDDTVDRLARQGLEVIAVRQDEPGIRDRLGLHAAKVIVPGTLPMTFGHANRRTRGLPRLLDVPHRLGRTPAPLRHAELPLHPHPFP